jgi:VanZ family protein
LLLCRGFQGEGVRRWLSVCLALVVASAYGVSDEWHQSFTAGRDSDVFDWVADVIGAVLGSLGNVALAARVAVAARSTRNLSQLNKRTHQGPP